MDNDFIIGSLNQLLKIDTIASTAPKRTALLNIASHLRIDESIICRTDFINGFVMRRLKIASAVRTKRGVPRFYNFRDHETRSLMSVLRQD